MSRGHLFSPPGRAITRGGLLLLITISAANAQEALRSAVVGDRRYQARTASRSSGESEPLSAGPFQFQASLSYSLSWNDNIYLEADNPRSDFIHRPLFNLRGSWQVTEDSALSFGVGIGYQKYMENTDLDSLVVTPDSELAWDMKVEDLVFTLYDRFEYSRDVISQGGLSGQAEFPSIENTAGFRARWYPAQYVMELGYGHYNFFSMTSDYDYLVRAGEQFFSRAGYRFAAETQTGVEVSVTLTDYDSRTRLDNQNLSIGPYIEWQVVDVVSLSIRGGYTIFVTDVGPFTGLDNKFGSYYFGFDLSHELTEYISHGLSVSRDVQQSVERGSTLTEQLNLSYSARWKLTDSTSLSGNTFYEHGKEPQFGFGESYDRVGFGASVSWQATQHASLGLNYRFTTKASNFPSRDYQQNSVTLSANYRF